MSHISVKMSYATTQFPSFSFFSPHSKPHVVRGLSKHYYFRLDFKWVMSNLHYDKYPVSLQHALPFFYNPWAYGYDPTKQPCYQPVVGCKYWPELGSSNNWNIIRFNNKTTPSEYIYTVHKLVIDGISYKMDSLVQLYKYGAINAAEPTTMGHYVINYLSEPYTLREDQTTDAQVSKSDEPVSKA